MLSLLRLFITGFLALFNFAHAAAILDVQDGLLLGARNVVVSGNAYDLRFVDGTCRTIFQGCDSNLFAFRTPELATAAGQAIIDQVMVDSNLGAFRTNPKLIVGCSLPVTQPFTCGVVTPFSSLILPDQAFFSMAFAEVSPFNPAGLVSLNGVADSIDTSTSGDVVFARWTRSVTVPAPTSLLLLVIGVTMMSARAKRVLIFS